MRLVCSHLLTARQRAVLHQLASDTGLHHETTEKPDGSRILSLSDKPEEYDESSVHYMKTDAATVSDEEMLLTVKTIFGKSSPNFELCITRLNSLGQNETLENAQSYVSKTKELLMIEHQEERTSSELLLDQMSMSSLEKRGRCMCNLRIEGVERLLGRSLVTFVSNNFIKNSEEKDASSPLPHHKFSQHDIVRIKPNKTASGNKESRVSILAEGVIYQIKEDRITVAVDGEFDELDLYSTVRIEKIANYIVHKRLLQALCSLEGGSHCSSKLYNVRFHDAVPSFRSRIDWIPINTDLSNSQKDAVTRALCGEDVVLIHGPPGTGKTTAVVEYIAQEVLRGSRVLACAASNIAVDNLVEGISNVRFSDSKVVNTVRIGHPARLSPQVLSYSLDHKVLYSDESSLARDCRQEIQSLQKKLTKVVPRNREEKKQIRKEIRLLYKEERKRQELAVSRVLSSAQVICSTLSGASSSVMSKLDIFDVVVIDEAAQAIEPACWIALLRGRKAVLAGDHLQLPPTILSQTAASRGLSVTLFERLIKRWGDTIGTMLLTQYRMNEKVMQWASTEMYGGKLLAHERVANHTLKDLVSTPCDSILSEDAFLSELLFIDTAGCEGMEEIVAEEGESLRNPGEAHAVLEHTKRLISFGLKPVDIGIISPYSAQVALLKSLRPSECIEVSTVDGFQGREKEAIIISMVRSNEKQNVGFLEDRRRMNVAVTRARRHCTIIGDSDTLYKNPFLERMCEYFTENGEYETAALLNRD